MIIIETLRVFEGFAGIGAISKAIENLNIPHELVGFSEIDDYAIQSFCAVHNVDESLNWGDICEIDETKLPDFDLYTFGSPCQDFSIAGKQKGSTWTCKDCKDDSGDPTEWNPLNIHWSRRNLCPNCGSSNIEKTRSSLVVEALRIIKYKKPRYLLMENVKNLVGKQFKPSFDKIISELEEYGYNTYWKVLNAKNYGIPQNRERVFVVSIKKDIDDGKFEFPKPFDNGLRLKNFLEDKVDKKYYIDNDKVAELLKQLREKNLLNGERICSDSSINDPQEREISNCITAKYDTGIQNQKQIGLVVAEPDNQDRIICEQRIDEGLRFFKDNVCGTIRTIDSSGDKRVIESDIKGCSLRTRNYIDQPQQLEVRKDDCCNSITTVSKDSMIAETETFPNELDMIGTLNRKGYHEFSNRVYSDQGIARTLMGDGGNSQDKTGLYLESPNELNMVGTLNSKGYESKRRVYSDDGISPTGYSIRKLTPKECWRLMGFTDEDYSKAKERLEQVFYKGKDRSNSQMYKQAGNSIVVTVPEAIFIQLFNNK